MIDQRALCVITGASRGYGRTLALVLAEAVAPSSVFLLLARDEAGLAETRVRMLTVKAGLHVETCAVDLGRADAPELSRCVAAVAQAAAVEVGILIHNAGSIGRPSLRAADHRDRSELLDYCGLNVASPVLLTSVYLSELRASARRHIVVNISSLAAVQALSSLSLYCTGKAARDAFFRSLALEEKELRVLSWAPGPMQTTMVASIGEESFDPEMRAGFGASFAGVDLEVSAKQLLKLLREDKFESGAHIDIYDVWQPESK